VRRSAQENNAVLLVLAWLALQGWYGPINYIEANNVQWLGNGSGAWSLHIDKAAAGQVADAAALKTWPFQDVTDITTWYYSAVRYVYAKELMKGVSTAQFAPNTTLNRAMLMTVLDRLAGTPLATGANPYVDVVAGTWYNNAVVWAA